MRDGSLPADEDIHKLRRFAMDVVRAMAEGLIDPQLTRDLALQWDLIEEAVGDQGQPWLTFTPLLLGDELDRDAS